MKGIHQNFTRKPSRVIHELIRFLPYLVNIRWISSRDCMFVCVQGAGTAIGELPPYFMTRAARLSGQIDEQEQEIEELIQEKQAHPKDLVSSLLLPWSPHVLRITCETSFHMECCHWERFKWQGGV